MLTPLWLVLAGCQTEAETSSSGVSQEEHAALVQRVEALEARLAEDGDLLTGDDLDAALEGYASEAWVEANYASDQELAEAVPDGPLATESWVESTLDEALPTGTLATEAWSEQTFATPQDVSDTLDAAVSDGTLASQSWVETTLATAVSDGTLASQSWVESTLASAVSSGTLASQTWVESTLAAAVDDGTLASQTWVQTTLAAALPDGTVPDEDWVRQNYVAEAELGTGFTWTPEGELVIDEAEVTRLAEAAALDSKQELTDLLDNHYVLATEVYGGDFLLDGAVRFADSTADCASEDDWGTLRYTAGQFTGCTPEGWLILGGADDGSSPANAAASCLALSIDHPDVPSGVYWLDGPEGPFETWCDMETDGGGWTVIANNDAGDTEPSGCLPRFGSDAAYVCGAGGDAQTDFVTPAWHLEFDELVWAAYDGTYEVTSYQYTTWTTTQSIPNTAESWYLQPDASNETIGDWSGLPHIYCYYEQNRPQALGNGVARSGAYSGDIVMLYTMEPDLTNYRMSFTDYNHTSTYQTRGLDDFQDGWGCSDDWQPHVDRGKNSFLMVR